MGGRTGRYSEEKLKVLGQVWAKQLDLRYPDMNLASKAGLEDPDQYLADSDQMEVDLGKLIRLKKTSSDPDDLASFARRG